MTNYTTEDEAIQAAEDEQFLFIEAEEIAEALHDLTPEQLRAIRVLVDLFTR